MTFNIFVSYSTKDLEKINPTLATLKTINDVRIFLAEDSIIPGGIITQTIKNAITDCDIFVLFYSSNAAQSNYVQQEVGAGMANQKIIIPILLDGTKPTAMLEGINYLDISDQTKYQNEINRLYNFIIANVQKKKQNQALAVLALMGLGYLMLKENAQ